jgi:hypothetical protein
MSVLLSFVEMTCILSNLAFNIKKCHINWVFFFLKE